MSKTIKYGEKYHWASWPNEVVIPVYKGTVEHGINLSIVKYQETVKRFEKAIREGVFVHESKVPKVYKALFITEENVVPYDIYDAES